MSEIIEGTFIAYDNEVYIDLWRDPKDGKFVLERVDWGHGNPQSCIAFDTKEEAVEFLRLCNRLCAVNVGHPLELERLPMA